MVSKKDKIQFMPSLAVPPGETIRENMVFLGMKQKELAARLDITPKHLSNIINGKAPITYDMALKLELVIGPSGQFWMDLESNYQLNRVRLEEQEKLKQDLEILKGIPYKKMSEFNWVKETSNRTERVLNCRDFFGVAMLSKIKTSYEVAFRMHKEVKEISDLGVLAWLRKAELEGRDVEVKKFNKGKLKDLIPSFKKLTLKEPDDFYPEMKRMCAKCGVALVFVPYLSKTYICGATIWRNKRPILALSAKGKRADGFWFTFFHELVHLIEHSNCKFHISYDDPSKEDEADIMASNLLIPKEQYRIFTEKYDYKNKDEIISYSLKIGIAPFILLGRLQYDGLVGYQYHNDLIPSLEIPKYN